MVEPEADEVYSMFFDVPNEQNQEEWKVAEVTPFVPTVREESKS